MAQKLYEESNIQAIANAIRSKNGLTTTYKTSEMAAAITALVIGGGGSGEDLVPNPITYSGDCSYLFHQGRNQWILKNYFDRIQITDATDLSYAFQYCREIERTPAITCKGGNNYNPMSYLYSDCSNLKEIGAITNCQPRSQFRDLFSGCHNLRYLPDFINIDFTEFRNFTLSYMYNIFRDCHSLRSISKDLLKEIWHKSTTTQYESTFNGCYVLDEIQQLSPRGNESKTTTSNMFSSTFVGCHRLKNLTFDVKEDGTPYTVNWSNQTIDLHDAIGWDNKSSSSTEYPVSEGKLQRIIGYNSGITSDKFVSGGTTYAALKNDPDWYTNNVDYSRFNHDSAVNLINSLPDASSGRSNTIILRSEAGLLTDGGSCGSLTEEEIAVAAAKGWTITYKTL